jgi:hypothetical protein
MGKHSARRRRAPFALAAGAAAVLAAGGFATTLADGSLEVPRVAAVPAPATPTTTLEPVTTRTTDRGDGLNRASRSFTRTAPPSTGSAPEDDAGSPSATPSVSESASSGAARTRNPGPSPTPSATPTPSTGPSAPSSPTTPTTPSATPSPTPTGSVLDAVPGIVGALLP